MGHRNSHSIRDTRNKNIFCSDDHLGVNASSIPTQVIPPVRKPVISSEIDGGTVDLFL